MIARRTFLQAVGAGGVALALWDGKIAWAAAAADGVQANAFVHIAADGEVTIMCARSEMGQGVRSSVHVLVADELGADLARVKIAQAVGDKKYGDQNTDGSSSVRGKVEMMRKMGATARELLVAAAAKTWKVKPSACVARDHAVWHKGKSLGFGALVATAATLPLPDAKGVKLRPMGELRHVGKELPLLDGPDIVTGKARFGADVTLPGMLIAVVARPPVVGGKVAKVDTAAALATPGVKRVIEIPRFEGAPRFQPLGGVAVLGVHTWAAIQGRRALHIEWEHGDNASYDSAAYKEELLAQIRKTGRVVRKVGDAEKALEEAARRVEAEYYLPHLAHAAMEPPAALARVDDSGAEVWACTQNPQSARTAVAAALKIPEEKVTVHVTLLGGGFGRKSKPDFIVEAAVLAREAGVPVRVQWTRDDDLRHDYFHTVSAQGLAAGLDDAGKVVAWRHRTVFPPIPSTFDLAANTPSEGELGQGVTDLPLAVPNVVAEAGEARARVRIGWLRSVCNVFHAFAVGSFMDELAHARGKDPKENLLELLGPPRKLTLEEAGVSKIPNYNAKLDEHPVDVGRHHRVIERACELAGWGKPGGRALGLAAHRSFLTYVAVVASVVRDGARIAVDEVWIVADAGMLLNVERVRSQLEGAVIFGMSIAFHGAITAKNGVVEQATFRDYPVLRMAEAPRKIHVDLIRNDLPAGGIGEPGVPPVAPAIANAVFKLTGKRVRELPIRI